MPLHDYQCLDCEDTFEELIRRPEDEAKVRCEHCGSGNVEKQLSTFSMGRGSKGSSGGSKSCCSGGSCGSCSSSCCH